MRLRCPTCGRTRVEAHFPMAHGGNRQGECRDCANVRRAEQRRRRHGPRRGITHRLVLDDADLRRVRR
ncbi:hypothetical protein [Halorhodospira neutriphila]|uniref:hypothetical protein n=1 Tax=Halorhodospira neutriphila TaxID=168379 RepID=UPI001903C6B2|nr:hypothetical protein [Halorhodospira neutriphila]